MAVASEYLAELDSLDPWDRVRVAWLLEARDKQLLPPYGYLDQLVLLLLAGRGFGKTRVGAEDCVDFCYTHPGARYAIVAPTFAIGRDVCIEGESGVLAHAPAELEQGWRRSEGLLRFPNGSTAKLYSSEKPDRLRGPQHHRAWIEELAAMVRMQATWDQCMFGLRLPQFGTPQCVVTTTPRPLRLIRDLLRRPTTYVVRGGTFENAENLSRTTLEELRLRYEGTRLGRQELYGEVLDDVIGTLWTGDMLAETRVSDEAWSDRGGFRLGFDRVAVGVDPSVAAEGSENMAETGIIGGVRVYDCPCGKASRKVPHALILRDDSLKAGPVRWGRAVTECMLALGTREVIGEVNNGGDLVRLNVKANWNSDRDDGDPRGLRYTAVRASTSKKTRAEPVAGLYEKGRVHHVGSNMAELEHQMCSWVPPEDRDEEYDTRQELTEDGEPVFHDSPDRVDALVWLVTSLLIDPEPIKRGGLSL